MLRISIVLSFLACRLAAQTPEMPPPDSAFYALVRSLLLESLRGGGVRADQRLIPANPESRLLFRHMGITIDSLITSHELLCPGSTTADDRPVPSPVGYVVSVSLALTDDRTAWRLGVSKSCTFVFRGNAHGFGEGGAWDIGRRSGAWRIVRALPRRVT